MEWPMMTERLVSIELRWKWFRCGCAATSAIDKKSDMTQLDIYETCSGDYEVILSFWVPIYSAVTVLWHCSDIARKPHWNCSFSFENLGRFFFLLKRLRECIETAPDLLWYCPEIALGLLLILPWESRATVRKRHWSGSWIALELPWNCTEEVPELPWNWSGIAL